MSTIALLALFVAIDTRCALVEGKSKELCQRQIETCLGLPLETPTYPSDQRISECMTSMNREKKR
jgi:hypothetical protein